MTLLWRDLWTKCFSKPRKNCGDAFSQVFPHWTCQYWRFPARGKQNTSWKSIFYDLFVRGLAILLTNLEPEVLCFGGIGVFQWALLVVDRIFLVLFSLGNSSPAPARTTLWKETLANKNCGSSNRRLANWADLFTISFQRWLRGLLEIHGFGRFSQYRPHFERLDLYDCLKSVKK